MLDLTLYPATLVWSTARVKDDLCIHASREDEADGPIRVGATQRTKSTSDCVRCAWW